MNYWWKEAVIYEVYVDKFAKNFRGMTERLDYLKNLGINCIWLLPHYPSPMADDGYDVSDYFNVRKDLGDLDDFKVFVEKAHDRGIRVIIDLVLNHVSVEHSWFREASSSVASPKRNYFLWSKTGQDLEGAANPFVHMTSGNWAYNKATDDYYHATFFPEQADLNWDNPEVFDEMMRVIDFWTGLGVDGFRLDAAGHLIKREGTSSHHLPEGHELIKRIRRHLEADHPEVVLLAESTGPIARVKPYFGTGDECHMVFNFSLMATTYLALKRGDRSLIDGIVRESFSGLPDNCQWATFVSNHDEINLGSLREPERREVISWLDPKGEYSFMEKGVSMRLATVFKKDKDKIAGIFKILFSLPGAPVVYYGSEIGMENLPRGNFTDSRKYVRGEFDWKEAEVQAADPDSILSRVAGMIRDRSRK